MPSVKRLFEYFQPDHYRIELSLLRKQRKFSGRVVLSGTATGKHPITLHAKDLIIASVTVADTAVAFTHHDDELTISGDFPAGSYTLTLVFSGKITDSMHGIYPCYYTHRGKKQELLATQFESHHAREVFPCIDEPEAKATFDLTLITENSVEVLSNMPLRGSKIYSPKSTAHSFQTTPRMSTYLLAFVVGNLHRLSATSANGTEVSVWATQSHPEELLRYSLTMSIRLLDFYEKYFTTRFPLPKIDHVALPDFDAQAMENWGLITYRESALLVDPKQTSLAARQLVASVISHELSHQWFGNLVTMQWWNDLWLNESFARLMEYIPLDALEPEWRVWNEFTHTVSGGALARDALDGIQAVQTDVTHPDEISALFDPHIVYSKGARLVRMLLEFVSEPVFRRGLSVYFERHAYGNTSAHDLWGVMSEVSGRDVTSLMNTWITQPGYPEVIVNDGVVAQKQFFIGPAQPQARSWTIPLGDATRYVLQKPEVSRSVPLTTPINAHDGAHFITAYSGADYTHFGREIAAGRYSAVDQIRLLQEQLLLSLAGKSSSSQTVQLLAAYRHATDPVAWSTIGSAIHSLARVAGEDDTSLQTFATSLASDYYNQLGWTPLTDEPLDRQKLRPAVVRLMTYGGTTVVIEAAQSQLAHSAFAELPPDTRVLAAGTALAHSQGDKRLFESLHGLAIDSASSDIRLHAMEAVSASRDHNQLQRLLAGLRDGSVRPQDTRRWVQLLMRSPYGRDMTWAWLRQEWPWLQATFGSDMSYSDYPHIAAMNLANTHQLDEFNDFFAPLAHVPSLKRSIALGQTLLSARIAQIERDRAELLKTLRESETIERYEHTI